MEKLDRLDRIPAAFNLSVEATLPELFDLLLESLTIEQSGQYVARTPENIARINTTIERFRELFYDSNYVEAVNKFSREFDAQKRLNDDLLRGLNYGATATTTAIAASEFVYTSTRRRAIELLLDDAPITSNFFNAIRETLLNSVNAQSDYVTMVRSLSNVVLGDERRQGRLLNWTKQVAHDSFAMSDRAYTRAASQNLGVEWYRYAGGLIQDSREFCVARNGKYWHVSEIEAWPDLSQWDGRMPNTTKYTIYEKCGGYRCNHSLIPVSEASVPQSALDRING